jgi:hypothetical protein
LWLALDPDVDEVLGATQPGPDAGSPVRLLVADGRALPLAASTFDLALFTWSLC